MFWIIVGSILLTFFCLLVFCLCRIRSQSDKAMELILRGGVEEPLDKLSLSIKKKAIEPAHPILTPFLKNMAEYFKNTGNKIKSKNLKEQTR